MVKTAAGKRKTGNQQIAVTPQTARHLNRATILDIIRKHQPLSRADLARLTGLHRSNVSQIVQELQNAGWLREERATSVGRGRTPTLIYLTRGGIGVIGIALHRTRTTIAFASIDGHIESSYVFDTPSSPEEFAKAVVDAAAIVTRDLNAPKGGRRQVGQVVLSVPGIITLNRDGSSTMWAPGLPTYSGKDLAAIVEKEIGYPTAMGNNAGLGAMAASRNSEILDKDTSSDFVFMVIGDFGVGSGVVIKRSLYSGYDAAYAGEVGHTVIDPNGPLCDCGRRGCWQLYICNNAIWNRYKPHEPFTPPDFERFLIDVQAGNSKALNALKKTAEYLSLGISNIALTLNPGKIIIAGSLVRIWSALEKELNAAFYFPQHQILLKPTEVPIDLLFLTGAIERAVDLLLFEPN